MIYTCYEMIRDCRDNRAEGWQYLAANYIPVMRKMAAHYAPEDTGLLERTLMQLRDPQSSLFQSLEPAPERWFVAELRQKLLAQMPPATPEISIDLETVASALEPLTVMEKQAAWLETMRYSPQLSAAMLRVAEPTVEKIRARAADLVRQKVDAWRREVLADNGPALGREADAASGKDCLTVKTFLDIIDGRMTWRGREELERHVNGCWHCVDHFCRMVEVVELLRGVQPLSEADAAPFYRLLGVEPQKKPLWKRLTGVA